MQNLNKMNQDNNRCAEKGNEGLNPQKLIAQYLKVLQDIAIKRQILSDKEFVLVTDSQLTEAEKQKQSLVLREERAALDTTQTVYLTVLTDLNNLQLLRGRRGDDLRS